MGPRALGAVAATSPTGAFRSSLTHAAALTSLHAAAPTPRRPAGPARCRPGEASAPAGPPLAPCAAATLEAASPPLRSQDEPAASSSTVRPPRPPAHLWPTSPIQEVSNSPLARCAHSRLVLASYIEAGQGIARGRLDRVVGLCKDV